MSAARQDVPDSDYLLRVFNRVEDHIEGKYGIPVVVKDVPSPFTGDLDGAEIHVDHEQDVEGAVFIIAHLFGHTVQWNTSERAREVGSRIYDNPSDEMLRELHEYEVKACRYSLQLFHDAGFGDLDQWLSDFAACDFRYLEHFYRTGEKRDFFSFWRDGEVVLAPLPIPDFRPQRWVSRWEGIVV
ncbi:MAG: hypothetical protein KJO07_00315 [Deltaproteobacteria bacterium]|nr:hypothetical protein [Deltaproteobacteria bacterium]